MPIIYLQNFVYYKILQKIFEIDKFDSSNYKIYREWEHIDILIEDESNVIIIENKIKSKINGERNDINNNEIINQLVIYAKKLKKTFLKNHHFFIFFPNYNKLDLEKCKEKLSKMGASYNLITYKKLHDFFVKYPSWR